MDYERDIKAAKHLDKFLDLLLRLRLASVQSYTGATIELLLRSRLAEDNYNLQLISQVVDIFNK